MGSPSYSLPKLVSRETAIVQILYDRELPYAELKSEDVDSLIQIICGLLPDTHVEECRRDREEAVRSLLCFLRGDVLDREHIRDFGRAVAGWWEELKLGASYTPWSHNDGPVWAPVVFENVERLVRRGRRYRLSMLVLAGQAVNMRWTFDCTGARLQWLIRHMGVSKKETYADTELCGMHVTALLIRGVSQLGMSDMWTSSSQLTLNKELVKGRKAYCRKEAFYADSEHTRVSRCFDCPLGRSVCFLSRHLNNYSIKGRCKNGHEGFMVGNGYCHSCAVRGRFRREDLDRKWLKKKGQNNGQWKEIGGKALFKTAFKQRP